MFSNTVQVVCSLLILALSTFSLPIDTTNSPQEALTLEQGNLENVAVVPVSQQDSPLTTSNTADTQETDLPVVNGFKFTGAATEDEIQETSENDVSTGEEDVNKSQLSSQGKVLTTKLESSPLAAQQMIPAQSLINEEACAHLAGTKGIAIRNRERAQIGSNFYCDEQRVIGDLLESGNHTCEQLAEALHSNDTGVTFPEIADPLVPSNQSLEAILNILHQGELNAMNVLRNMSELEESNTCVLRRLLNMPCDRSIVCEYPSQPEKIFYCETAQHTADLEVDLNALISNHRYVMSALLGLTVDIDEHEDIMAPADDNEVVVRKYTMGGFYHIKKQMDVIIETIDAMCPSQ